MSVLAKPKPKTGAPGTSVPNKDAQHPKSFEPAPPRDFKDAGLDPGIVESLILKYLLGVGSATGATIASELCLPSGSVTQLLAALKQQQIVVHVKSASMGDFDYTMTDAGRERAARAMLESMYVGPAPVPIDVYVRSVRAQTIANMHPQESELRRAFSDLLINQQMFDTLGPAINSGRGMFLYGPAGNGKTSIAERITACFGDEVWIPHCLSCDGLIIKLFDPACHVEVGVRTSSIMKSDQVDRRWVKIKRPTIVVGGELTMDTLEVRYNSTSKTCEAPIQTKSNCGTLVIDDFGRQRMKPIELLNRWIVPLEKRIDFLTLPNGKKIDIPFDQLIIFATNLEPKDLCDDAFLRRVPYKILISDPAESEFRKLFELVATKIGLTIDDAFHASIDHVIREHYERIGRPFRCCQPRDLLMQVHNRCLYLGEPLRLSPELLDYAVSVYFTIM